MNKQNEELIALALAARTLEEANQVQDLIAALIGARNERPLGDTWNNQGILTASGSSYDHKALEVVTNMQDAVLELLAIQKYGSRAAVPFKTPHAAAADLLGGLDKKQQAGLATVTVDRSEPASNKKRVTLTMRDHGCGIADTDVPRGIFRVGAKHKDGIDWQQGTFGLGGATTYRNAQSIVLVTRRHPDLLDGSSDRITVAVVQWERHRTTVNAFYLVTDPWEEDNPVTWSTATPLSVPASDYPDFEPGTHLALVSYETEGLGRRSGDERSFDTVLNTRLYRPVTPIEYRNNLTRSDRIETLDGLERRLNDNPGDPGTEGSDTLPFNHNGTTYQLPIRFRMFSKPGAAGERRNYVAKGHALLVSSNGQAHFHWSPQEFKNKTNLNKLYNRIFVAVDSDALPIELRTELFTADRSQLVRTAAAIRLENEIVAFLDSWTALRDANNDLIREAIAGDNNDRPTIAIAEKIARAMKVKGFSIGGSGGSGGGAPKPPKPTPPEDLYDDPTHFEGSESVEVVVGAVKSIYFRLNAKDDFLGAGRRAELEVTCDHPDIGSDEITVGQLRSGRVRVALAIPDSADLGNYLIRATIPQWPKTSGGIGPKFEWSTKIEVVDEATTKPPGSSSGSRKGKSGPGEGGLVALIWKTETDDGMDEWKPSTVGEIEMVEGTELASQREEYKDLAKVDSEIPTIVLNRTYSPLKSYVQARAVELTDEGKEQARERYAVGVGVALLLLDQEQRKREKAGEAMDEAAVNAGRKAAARAVLSVMPDYDRLAKELDD
ncbi:MAG: hypothetical protein HN396_08120 [Gemmatimonadales bacterium]|jgi:hypothetical protein|nr:hypothetical protein [Gemmatimonadales bacterium]MBT3774892.1 hypothetical protein [Gemmatimonadales bacterium]MBT5044319.1 hypothetical protein [Gemmatimonadales bacterium]MBT7124580.1 hypothetical protein [Gemmatimonadales bacterium]MBT7691943.1 hypothetical protein [Gemmatimonadales bacterium]